MQVSSASSQTPIEGRTKPAPLFPSGHLLPFVLVTVLFSGLLRFSGAWPLGRGRAGDPGRSAYLIVVWPAADPPTATGRIAH